jgi:hypothetical protein
MLLQDAITGAEELGDVSQPTKALAKLYRGFKTRDLNLIDANVAPTDDVVIDDLVGGIRRGRDQPHLMYERIFKSPADLHVECWDYTINQVQDVFLAIGRERGTYFCGERRHDVSIRTTRVCRRYAGQHAHATAWGEGDPSRLLALFADDARGFDRSSGQHVLTGRLSDTIGSKDRLASYYKGGVGQATPFARVSHRIGYGW